MPPGAEPLTRADFPVPLHPLSRPQPLPVRPERIWSDADWARIKCGLRSDGRDDRWDVLTEGDTVHVHRSWTGHQIYAATFEQLAGRGWRIAEVLVERNPERYGRAPEEFDRVMLEMVLSGILLGERDAELYERWRAAAGQRGQA
ncbi:hypothetical protein [Kitasatospora sp. NPDC057198]|uniref:hypothetical protein n=1 Tax=Kitasatospora sp. NPDC057198 TaxID=3346046 RepID=UPI00363EF139